MQKIAKDQLNFNTVLLILVGALVTLGVAKADRAFESITRLQVHQEEIIRRVDNMENFLGIANPRQRNNP